MTEAIEQSLNEYLAAEWGFVGEISATSPFELRLLGQVSLPDRSFEVFEFLDDDGERYFALGGRALNFLPAGQMSLDDLRLQELGRTWIGDRDPVDLDTVKLGYDHVPSMMERRDALRKLIEEGGLDAEVTTILEGVFLTESRQYIALAETSEGSRVALLGEPPRPVAATMLGLSPSRQLSHAVGSHLCRSTAR